MIQRIIVEYDRLVPITDDLVMRLRFARLGDARISVARRPGSHAAAGWTTTFTFHRSADHDGDVAASIRATMVEVVADGEPTYVKCEAI